MEKQFSDERGNSKVIIEGSNAPLNIDPSMNYVLSNAPKNYKHNSKKKVKATDIGIKSNGFAAVATLALIVAAAGALIAFFTLRY